MTTTKSQLVVQTATAITAITLLSLIVAAAYLAIVRLWLSGLLHIRETAGHGFTVNFGEIALLAGLNLVAGYLVARLLKKLSRGGTTAEEAVIAALCMPALYVLLSYSSFRVDWRSVPTYIYLALLLIAGACIPYLRNCLRRMIR